MACLSLPAFPSLPDLGPLSLEPPELPSISLSADFCCKIEFTFSFVPAIPLGPAIIAIPGASAVIALINQALGTIDAYVDMIPLDCPLE